MHHMLPEMHENKLPHQTEAEAEVTIRNMLALIGKLTCNKNLNLTTQISEFT